MAIGDIDLTRMNRDGLGRLADMLPGLKWGSPVGSEAHAQTVRLMARVIAAQEDHERD
ncbi:hypothetical protein ACH4FV_02010 [Streptomyces anulatus]|uniref:hypothetical protein n=1 Tax=Streptomyces anulatus TaxID=1892 RepID=UPI00224D9542|nr:hypothetical protein [Streptomyces anulatus]MCX4520991.1 hypothetical protein [Streptomyces anulatus]MCX4603861.1 hypothetical protein [Streptomyces anulatus]WSU76085.1 hypothetical protein OG499_25475 [Streptomyces anulatus]WTD12463.1 hypothetical protein OHA54_25940 [Streptomyces anulatus]WTE05774.1 hypothetical protein OH765_26045 [Streptomyces anulatus]